MKSAIFAVLLTTALIASAVPPKQITKSSNKKEFHAAAEVKAFYLKLLDADTAVKADFEALARKSESAGDVHSGTAEPQVVEWFPRSDRWSAGAEFHNDARFLVVQPLSFGRPGQLDYDGAIVSEFRVLHDGETRIDPKDPDEKSILVNNRIIVQFLGFRDFRLTPAKASK